MSETSIRMNVNTFLELYFIVSVLSDYLEN